ncbi:MAG: peroxide stress protein YaaA, partial [Bacteroidia bacterium]|nr:peroxide stress protein YaaA [Bacteroidia bacterium]
DVDFLQMEPKGYKTIVIYTKKARGMMTRFVIENRIQDSEHLKGFDCEGYLYNPDLSNENKMVFTR